MWQLKIVFWDCLSCSIPYFNMVQCLSLLFVVSLLLSMALFPLVAVIRKAELTKKMEIQSQSPSKRSLMKPAVRQTRPTQHHSCPRRRPTGDTLPWSVTQLLLSAGEPPIPTATYFHCRLQFGFGIHFVLLVTVVCFCHVCFVFDHNKNWLPYMFQLPSFVFVHILSLFF